MKSSTSKQNCGSCGWWYQNPIQPDKVWGICSVDTAGIVTVESPSTKRSKSCKKWSAFEDAKYAFLNLMATNQSPSGCARCPNKIHAYKTSLCLKSTFVSLDSGYSHYRKCSLMTPAMCQYSRKMDAMKKYLSEAL